MKREVSLIGEPQKRIRISSVEEKQVLHKGQMISIDRERMTAHMFRDRDPVRFGPEDFKEFMNRAVFNGASDISFMSDSLARVEINGVYYNATRKELSSPEVDDIMVLLTGSNNSRTEINAMKELDFAYEMILVDGERQRFRVNITGCLASSANGIEISMRTLPRVTPNKDSVGLTDEELAAMMPKDGLIVMAGGTGHGKTTTMAAITAEHLLSTRTPVKIIDIQAPIEFTFRDILGRNKMSSSFIVQMGVGVNIKSFDAGVRAALRKKPQIISVGEARDSETISAAIEGSLTGHLVYTTTHSDSIAATIQRLLSRFEGAEREAKANDLCSSLRFIMVQHLAIRVDKPGRIAVREYLRITERIRQKLSSLHPNDWAHYLTQEVNGEIEGTTSEDMRRPMKVSAQELYAQGIISREEALALSRKMNTVGDKNE